MDIKLLHLSQEMERTKYPIKMLHNNEQGQTTCGTNQLEAKWEEITEVYLFLLKRNATVVDTVHSGSP